MSLKNQNGVYVHMGSRLLKMATVQGSKVAKAEVYPIPEGMNMQDLTDSVSLLTATFKKAKKQGKFPSGKCVLVMDSASSIIRHLQLPYMNDEQIYQNVLSEISGYLPVDSERFSIDYRVQDIIEVDDVMQLKVMVVAIAKTRLTPIIDALKNAGLRVHRVEIAENALEKLVKYASSKGVIFEENYGIINIGSKNLSINMFYQGKYFINKVVKGASSSIDAILTDNNATMDTMMAEQYKHDTNFFDDDSAECQDEVKAKVDRWIFEINRVIDYYSNRNDRAEVEKLFICGGGSAMEGLIDYFNEKFSIPVEDCSSLVDSLVSPKANIQNIAYFPEIVGSKFLEVVD